MKILRLALLAGAASGLAVPSSATVFTTTVRASVSSGIDNLGSFSFAGADLTGAGVVMVFTIDDERVNGYNFTSASNSGMGGGRFFCDGIGCPIQLSPITATIAINNRTLAVAGNHYSTAFSSSAPAPTSASGAGISYDNQIGYSVEDTNDTQSFKNNLNFQGEGYAPFMLSNFRQSQFYSYGSADFTRGSLSMRPSFEGQRSLFNFKLDSIETVNAAFPASAVPDASVWAMMIMGFGLTGAVQRVTKRAKLKIV